MAIMSNERNVTVDADDRVPESGWALLQRSDTGNLSLTETPT